MIGSSPLPWHWEDYRMLDGTVRLMSTNGDSVLRIPLLSGQARVPSPEDGRLLAASPQLAIKLHVIVGQLHRQTPDGFKCLLCDGMTAFGADRSYHNASCCVPEVVDLLARLQGEGTERTVLDEIAEEAA